MTADFIPLSRLDAPALARLAELHCAVMHTLLSDLGLPLVLRYYQAAQKDPQVLGLCSLSASGEVEAWALGSPHPSRLAARLRQPLGWFAGQMLRLVLTHPAALLDLLRSLLSAPDVNVLAPAQIELTYIAVSPGSQGRGLGKAVLAAFCEAARRAGYSSVALSVETDNPAALGLYTGYGFTITRTFREGRFERHRMEYSLT